MEEHGVHERAVRVTRCRVHHHAALLVDDDDVAVLKEHGKGDILRLGLGGFRLRDAHLDAHVALHRGLGLAGLAVHGDFAVLDEGLNAGAGELRQLGCQILVQTGAELVFYNDEHVTCRWGYR